MALICKLNSPLKCAMLILLCLYSSGSYSAFMVTQTSFGIDLDKPVTVSTTLINQSDKQVRVRVDFAKPTWAKSQYYLGEQLVAYPKIVSIPPNGKIQVMIAPRIKKDLPDGEYVALLLFKELPPREPGAQITMLMNIGVPYYARKGKLEIGMDFENLRIEKLEKSYQLKGLIKNTANFSYTLDIEVKFYLNQKLVKEQKFKQGVFRENLVELSQTVDTNEDVDYVEIAFSNKKHEFLETLNFSRSADE